ncbi:heparan sulfate glucosamine 3-O-sulfotransferase 1-like [Tubulanus polymorphus]|uniref:heparan sulfate glucosamine 3-O-sulfotransferase 1-like n=1 Tax=Tubulanus polymorphus TaxID=672921 RepID=UPI003DA63D29
MTVAKAPLLNQKQKHRALTASDDSLVDVDFRAPPIVKRKCGRSGLIVIAAICFFIILSIFARLMYASILGQPFLCLSSDQNSLKHSSKSDHTKQQPTNLHIRGTKRRLPQCIVIGVRKCGTRALLEFLNLHPDVNAAMEEIHFFDNDDNYKYGLDWYRKRMPYSFPHQVTIEKSPAYFITEEVPQRIYAMNSSIKLLLIVRNPTVRTISDYTQIHYNKLARNKSHQSFEQLAIDQVTGKVNLHLKAIRTSIYHRHMERWLEIFPASQVLIVDGDELIRNPIPQIKRVEKFLGLAHRITRENFYFNETKGFYCMRNEGQDHCLGTGKGRKHPRVHPEVMEKLNNFFRPHNERFFEMTGTYIDWP